jgi:predicted CopG family antitoxin
MTKTISLADDAYEALARAKKPGESFSDVARRLAKKEALDRIFDPAFKLEMSDEEADRIIRDIYRARDEGDRPPVKFD